jgi:hypothetical protein
MEDGRLEIRYRGQPMKWEELAERPQPNRAVSEKKKSKPYGGTPPAASRAMEANLPQDDHLAETGAEERAKGDISKEP